MNNAIDPFDMDGMVNELMQAIDAMQIYGEMIDAEPMDVTDSSSAAYVAKRMQTIQSIFELSFEKLEKVSRQMREAVDKTIQGDRNHSGKAV